MGQSIFIKILLCHSSCHHRHSAECGMASFVGHVKSTATVLLFVCNNDSVLPLLQQPYHCDLDVMTVNCLTPNGEEPGECDYKFAASCSNVEELAEFDYRGDIKSNHASQSSDDKDDLYWGPKLQPTTDHDNCDHSNANPDCDNTNCNITYSSIHSDPNTDILSPDDDNDRSLYGAALPDRVEHR